MPCWQAKRKKSLRFCMIMLCLIKAPQRTRKNSQLKRYVSCDASGTFRVCLSVFSVALASALVSKFVGTLKKVRTECSCKFVLSARACACSTVILAKACCELTALKAAPDSPRLVLCLGVFTSQRVIGRKALIIATE